MNTPRISTESLSALIQGRRPAPGAGRAPDAPATTQPETAADAARVGALGWTSRQSSAFLAGVAAAKSLDALDEVDALLNELDGLVRQSAKAAPDALDGVRARIDAVVGTINRAAESVTGGAQRGDGGTVEYSRWAGGSRQLPPSPFAFSNIAVGTEQVRANVLLPPGGSLDVNVQVTVSAQQAGFFLSFGGATINLSAADARFVIEITGNGGAQELSFASGTSIGSMRDAINSFTEATGVVATASGTGLTVKSVEFGDDQFVSVRMVDTGGINTAIATGGVYVLNATNNNAALPNVSTLFTAASNRITDLGQDIDGVVNGWNAVGNGRSLYAVTQNLQTQFRLSGEAAQSNQPFRAYTITRDAVAGDEPPTLRAEQISRGGATALAELRLARQHNARARESLVQLRETHREAAAALLPTSTATPINPLDPARVRALLTPSSITK